MITVTSTLRDGSGNPLQHGRVAAHNPSAASAAAEAWGRGRLLRVAGPNAYVEHVWRQIKPDA